MTTVLQFALLGLGAGAIYALLGQGLVLIFRGSGVLNLAHGALAMVGAFVYYELHAQHGHGMASSIVATVVLTAALGIAIDQGILRRMRSASALARLIATLGVLLVIQSLAVKRYGAGATLVEPLITPKPVDVLGATVPSDRLWLFAMVIVITLVLTAAARWSRVGWAML